MQGAGVIPISFNLISSDQWALSVALAPSHRSAMHGRKHVRGRLALITNISSFQGTPLSLLLVQRWVKGEGSERAKELSLPL